MLPATLGSLKADFPGRTPLVAAMGAIRKLNADVRPLHDGTHFVQLNNEIVFQDQLQYPGPEDAAYMLRYVQEESKAMFALWAARLDQMRMWMTSFDVHGSPEVL
jgi:hypothetical protein